MRYPKTMAAALTCAALVIGTTSAQAAIEPVPYALTGVVTTLANAESGGPTLNPGVYRAKLPNDGSARSFAIDRSQLRNFVTAVTSVEREGSSLTASGDHSTEVAVVDQKQNPCLSQSERLSKDRPLTPLVTVVGASADPDDTRYGYFGASCRESKKVSIVIKHTGVPASGQTDAEIRVSSEPAITGSTGPSVTPDQTKLITAPVGQTHDAVEPGRGFGEAATLLSGTYPVELTYGSVAYYRVRLGYGQRLAASMTVPRKDTNFAPPAAVRVQMYTWSPELNQLDPQTTGDYSDDVSLSASSSTAKELLTFTGPVLWSNRKTASDDAGDVGSNSLKFTTSPGWYTLTIAATPPSFSSDPPPSNMPAIPASLSIVVLGAEQAGPSTVNNAGVTSTAVPASEMSIGKGTDQGTSVPWVRLGLSALTFGLAAAAVLWARRLRA